MDFRDVDWMVAVPVVLGGLAVLGAFWRHRRSGPDGSGEDESVQTAALRARYQVLERQLRELEEGCSGRSADVLAQERQALEEVAAQVRRQLEGRGASPEAGGPQAPARNVASFAAGTWARMGRRGLLWSAAGSLLLGLVILSVAQASRPRSTEEAVLAVRPQSGAHGLGPAASAPASAEEAKVKAALDRDPEDVEARLELARLRLDQEDYMTVWAETEKVLKQSAGNPRALTYQSQVRLAMGQPEVALSMLKEALAQDPKLLQAYVYVSYVYLRVGQTRDAEEVIAETKRRFPGEAATLDRGFAQMKASLAGQVPLGMDQPNPHAAVKRGERGGGESGLQPTSPQGANPHTMTASLAAASGSKGGPTAGTPPTGAQVSGTLELDRVASGGFRGGVVFVTVRKAGVAVGPPLAAKKLEATSFPLAFELRDSDSMQGEPIPARILLEARLDADGDPATKEPGDLVARRDDLASGAKDVHLVLKPR